MSERVFDIEPFEASELDAGEPEEIICLEADGELAGERIDKFISVKADMSRAKAVKLIEGEAVLVNGKIPAKNYKIKELDRVEIALPELEVCSAAPENIPIDIIYEDSDIIVINKPKGMIVHPATNIYTGTLVNALLYHCGSSLSGIGGVIRPGIVHRIDKDTSGLLVVAKNDEAHACLSAQLKTHTVSRVYHALAVGGFRESEGTVNAPIGRHPTDRKKMAVILDGKNRAREAITHYRVLDQLDTPHGKLSYIECRLETGRTHQIRVHMSHISRPLLGDEVYGGTSSKLYSAHKNLLQGQCLHAKKLELIHPRTQEKMVFECPLPEYMEKILEKCRA